MNASSSIQNYDGTIERGWLTKRGSFVPTWKRRYFTLSRKENQSSSSATLSYFVEEDCSQLKGSMIVSLNEDGNQATKRFAVNRLTPAQSHSKWDQSYCIEIITPLRTLVVSCDDVEDADRWSAALLSIINPNAMQIAVAGTTALMNGGGGGTGEGTAALLAVVQQQKLDHTLGIAPLRINGKVIADDVEGTQRVLEKIALMADLQQQRNALKAEKCVDLGEIGGHDVIE